MTERLQKTATVLAGCWIVVTMVFYGVRYSLVMYQMHRADIDGLLGRIGALLGGG